MSSSYVNKLDTLVLTLTMYLTKKGIDIVLAQETRNLIRELEKRNLILEPVRHLDDKLELGMKSGMKINRGGEGVCVNPL